MPENAINHIPSDNLSDIYLDGLENLEGVQVHKKIEKLGYLPFSTDLAYSCALMESGRMQQNLTSYEVLPKLSAPYE